MEIAEREKKKLNMQKDCLKSIYLNDVKAFRWNDGNGIKAEKKYVGVCGKHVNDVICSFNGKSVVITVNCDTTLMEFKSMVEDKFGPRPYSQILRLGTQR